MPRKADPEKQKARKKAAAEYRKRKAKREADLRSGKKTQGIEGNSQPVLNRRGKLQMVRTKDKKRANPHGYVDPIPTTPENRAREGPICGRKRTGKSPSGPGICCMPAGQGTGHPGFGWCRWHGGNTPSGITYALRERMMKESELFYGGPRDISPGEALLEEVQRTAGHVRWLQFHIDERARKGVIDMDSGEHTGPLGDKALVQANLGGAEPSVWIKMYQDERMHLARVSKMALDAGVAERQVRLAEEQGKLLATAVSQILNGLGLTPEQQVLSKQVVRSVLSALPVGSDGMPTSDDEVVDAEIVED